MKLPRFELGRKRSAVAVAQPLDERTAEDARRLERKNDPNLGVQHQHEWRVLDTLPRLQSAHDSMRWDVSKSRVLSVKNCVICNTYDRTSAAECADADCSQHKICARPYR